MQAVIAAGIIGPLVQLLLSAEFEIKKEAAWAISNATSGGTHEQIKCVFSEIHVFLGFCFVYVGAVFHVLYFADSW